MTKKEVLDILGLKTDLDLLNFLPYKYEFLKPSILKPIEEYLDGEKIYSFCTISKLKIVQKARIIRFEGIIGNNVKYNFMIYNQMFYSNRLSDKLRIFIVASYNLKMKVFMVTSLYNIDSPYIVSGLKPIYKLPKKVPQSYFIKLIDKVLNSQLLLYVHTSVPSDLAYKYKLIEKSQAYFSVHQPKNEEDLKQGLRVFKYEECLAYCLKIHINKRYLEIEKKTKFNNIDDFEVNRFISNLPFTLTKDQHNAVSDIVNDMNSTNVMFRLLQGDVSSGKTIVAFIAMYANYLRNGQSVMFAPTTTLVNQHYQNALQIFKGINIKIRCLMSKTSASERKTILKELKNGDCTILFATLSGINDDIEYKNLALTIIDEQQNFGVDQRSKMISKGKAIDTLMLSATPIPRTLNKIKNGDMSLSEIKEFPNSDKRNVTTKVIKSNDPIIKNAIEKALSKNRQVFIVVPRIDEDEEDIGNRISAIEVYEEYKKEYGEDKVQLLNGRMKISEQEKVLKLFQDNVKPILITTSVIEVGIDIKEAGLMIIYSANFFGLSALHQLRGRIGRNGKFAMALLVYDGDDKKAYEKLKFLEDNMDGFKIAEYDLSMRGGGSLNGTEQWGDSNLNIADFSKDLNIFQCAFGDARIINENVNLNYEYKEYVKKVLNGEDLDKYLLI